jgi:hypothetical protein
MMDPVSALGVASAVVQFVDFGTKLISKTRSLRKSSTGALVEHRELTLASTRLSDLSSDLDHELSRFASARELTQEEAALQQVAEECRQLALEFSETLAGFTGRPGQNVFKSFRQAFKLVWHKEGLESMQVRLDQQRQQLIIHLLVVVR